MEPIYAVSLSLSQGSFRAYASGHMLVTDQEDRRLAISLSWGEMPPVTKDASAAEWLLAMLSHLVENFDAHDVLKVQVEPVDEMED